MQVEMIFCWLALDCHCSCSCKLSVTDKPRFKSHNAWLFPLSNNINTLQYKFTYYPLPLVHGNASLLNTTKCSLFKQWAPLSPPKGVCTYNLILMLPVLTVYTMKARESGNKGGTYNYHPQPHHKIKTGREFIKSVLSSLSMRLITVRKAWSKHNILTRDLYYSLLTEKTHEQCLCALYI